MRYLIVNADDFGLSESVNRGILDAHDEGIVTSASLMVERPAALEAADRARERPRLGLGLHVEVGRWRVSWLPKRGSAWSAAVVERRAAEDLRRQLDRFRAARRSRSVAPRLPPASSPGGARTPCVRGRRCASWASPCGASTGASVSAASSTATTGADTPSPKRSPLTRSSS